MTSPINSSKRASPQRQIIRDSLTALSDDETLIEPYNPPSKEGREWQLGRINRLRESEWMYKAQRRKQRRRAIQLAKRLQGKMKTL
jgi:hypothetical protein